MTGGVDYLFAGLLSSLLLLKEAEFILKPWQKYLVIALFAYGFFSRFWGLGDKAFHHDESIHCFYSYELATEGRLRGPQNDAVTFGYDPVYHGPFLYHFSALIYFLLGDNDYTARVPFAIMGMILLFLVWECRKLLGVPMAIGMLGMAVLSPIVTYYSRFAREDVNVGTAFFAVAVYGALYLKEKKSKDLLLCVLALIIGYSMKESSYIYGFALGSFAVAWGLIRLIRFGMPELKSWFGAPYPFIVLLLLYGCFSFFVFTFVAVDYRVDPKQHGLVGGVIDIARNAFNMEKLSLSGPELAAKIKAQQRFFTDSARASAKWTYIFTSFLLTFGLLAAMEFFRFYLFHDRKPQQPVKVTKKKEMEEPPQPQAMPTLGLPEGALPLIICGSLWFLMFLCILAKAIVPFIVAVILWISFELVRQSHLKGVEENPSAPALVRMAAPWVTILSSIGIVLLVYYFLFTQMFANPPGLKKGIYDYIEYWFGHQLGEYRLFGPFWFYIARMIFYEFAFLLIATFGVVIAAVAVLLKKLQVAEPVTRTMEPAGPFTPFFVLMIWMAIFNTIIYGYLHEKAPWLGFHQAIPWCMVAGGVLGWGLTVWPSRWFRLASAVLVTPLLLITLKVQLQVNLNWADNTAELVSQQQADRDVRDMVKLVYRLAEETGLYEDFPIATEDEVEWPFPWYFRHYKHHMFKTASTDAMVQFGDDSTFTEMRAKLGDKYFYRKYLHRGAWIENSMDEGDLPGGTSFWANIKAYYNNVEFKGKPFRLLFWNYFFHRERWSDINPKYGYVYIRKECLPTLEPLQAPAGSLDAPRRLTPELKLQAPQGQAINFKAPRGLRFDPEGNLQVVDSLNGRVVVMNDTGAFVRSYGGPESGVGRLTVDPRFGGPSSIAFDTQGNSYVADTWGHRIVKFDRAGNYLLSWGSGGPEGTKRTADFYGPRGVEVGPDGKVYVTDTGPKEIEVFEQDGTKAFQFCKSGQRKGELDEPVGMRFGPDGLLYVCDTGNERIQVFSPQGVFRNSWPVPGWNMDKVGMEPQIDFMPNGNVVISLSRKNNIRIFTPGGKAARNFEIGGPKSDPLGVTVGRDGKLWFTDRTASTVNRVAIPEN